ncbi:MAG: hypothetical protein PVH61_41895 [Candidatus Aminicenantes bacterium]|jgi:hypothetical protein
MSQGNRKRQCNDFASVIFGKQFNDLTQDKQWFIFIHVKEYEKYRDAIIQRLTGIFVLKGGSQFQIIREWYYKRIPLNILLQSIDQCCKYLQRTGKPLTSLKYFQPEINSRFLEMQKNSFRSPHENREEKWLWPEYLSWKEDKSSRPSKFDLFYGRIPLR